MFYNGAEDMEERTELRLSQAYEHFEGEPNLELKVRVLNINAGHNAELMEQCRMLKEYAQYVARVRKYTKEMEFLRKNKSEVIAMSIFEYDKEEEERKLIEREQRRAEKEAKEAEEREKEREHREEKERKPTKRKRHRVEKGARRRKESQKGETNTFDTSSKPSEQEEKKPNATPIIGGATLTYAMLHQQNQSTKDSDDDNSSFGSSFGGSFGGSWGGGSSGGGGATGGW